LERITERFAGIRGGNRAVWGVFLLSAEAQRTELGRRSGGRLARRFQTHVWITKIGFISLGEAGKINTVGLRVKSGGTQDYDSGGEREELGDISLSSCRAEARHAEQKLRPTTEAW